MKIEKPNRSKQSKERNDTEREKENQTIATVDKQNSIEHHDNSRRRKAEKRNRNKKSHTNPTPLHTKGMKNRQRHFSAGMFARLVSFILFRVLFFPSVVVLSASASCFRSVLNTHSYAHTQVHTYKDVLTQHIYQPSTLALSFIQSCQTHFSLSPRIS